MGKKPEDYTDLERMTLMLHWMKGCEFITSYGGIFQIHSITMLDENLFEFKLKGASVNAQR
jgi:hypothetical protein